MQANSRLAKAWHIAAFSRELGTRFPLARTLLDTPLVLFRDAGDQVVALEDRCPHRNVALSLGALEMGTVRCGYHGWRFDGRGQCVEAPTQLARAPLPTACVRRFEARERDGFVWVLLEPEGPLPIAAA